MMRRVHAMLWLAAWRTATCVASRRRPRLDQAAVAGLEFPGQTRGRGFRLSEWARDRLRIAWLRIRVDGGD